MHFNSFVSYFVVGCLALGAGCGGDSGGTSSESTADATGAATTVEPSTGTATEAVTETGGNTQGGTQGGTGETGATSTGGPDTSSSSGETGETGTGTSTGGGDLCADFEPSGCMEKGCPAGQVCKVLEDECVSSSCSCNPENGQIDCTPDCNGGSCVAAVDCPDVLCDLFCEGGFKKDREGCEICECEEQAKPCECTSDVECVKTSSGCCPCNAGGDEVAAHVACVDQVMKCDLPPDQVNCPQVFLCTDAQAVCVQGQCVLN